MNIFSSADWLSADLNIGYGVLPIPDARDIEITELIKAWLKLDVSIRQAETQKIREQQRYTLLAYSERMASLAVRTRDQEKIFFGLLALGIDGWRGEWRDNAEIVALHYDAAQRIDESPDQIFDRAATKLSLKVATALRSFLRRSSTDRSLTAMGYSVGSDTDGFRYKRDW